MGRQVRNHHVEATYFQQESSGEEEARGSPKELSLLLPILFEMRMGRNITAIIPKVKKKKKKLETVKNSKPNLVLSFHNSSGCKQWLLRLQSNITALKPMSNIWLEMQSSCHLHKVNLQLEKHSNEKL